jgi:hypothetical protein
LFDDFGEVYRRHSQAFANALEAEPPKAEIRLVGNELAKRSVGFGN